MSEGAMVVHRFCPSMIGRIVKLYDNGWAVITIENKELFFNLAKWEIVNELSQHN